MRTHRLVAIFAIFLASAWLWIGGPPFTDGDSCLYAAMGRDMAASGNWAAPTWAHNGVVEFFYENPPGAMWLSSLFQYFSLDGFSGNSAPLLANVWWLGLLVASVWRLAGGRRGAGALAVFALVLCLPVSKYALRASLEIPFAACVCAALESLRARRRRGAILAGIFFAGAILCRGVFGLMLPLLWLADARVGHQRPMSRVLSASVLGLSLVVLFDLFHQLQSGGPSFWVQHFEQQVLPSLLGTAAHPNSGSTWAYYAGRLLLYSSPWCLLIFWRLPSRLRRMRPEVPLCIWWIAVVYVGAALGQREGSRYLFAAWPAVAILFSALWREDFEAISGKWKKRINALTPLLIPMLFFIGSASAMLNWRNDPWQQSARALNERASYGWDQGVEPTLFSSDFSKHDDRLKQFLRWHLNTWAFHSADPELEIQRPAWKVRQLDLKTKAADSYTFWCPVMEAQALN